MFHPDILNSNIQIFDLYFLSVQFFLPHAYDTYFFTSPWPFDLFFSLSASSCFYFLPYALELCGPALQSFRFKCPHPLNFLSSHHVPSSSQFLVTPTQNLDLYQCNHLPSPLPFLLLSTVEMTQFDGSVPLQVHWSLLWGHIFHILFCSSQLPNCYTPTLSS